MGRHVDAVIGRFQAFVAAGCSAMMIAVLMVLAARAARDHRRAVDPESPS